MRILMLITWSTIKFKTEMAWNGEIPGRESKRLNHNGLPEQKIIFVGNATRAGSYLRPLQRFLKLYDTAIEYYVLRKRAAYCTTGYSRYHMIYEQY